MPESTNEKNEILLTAYLDGELNEKERAQAEELLKSPEYSDLVEQWRNNAVALRSLPKFKLDKGFADRVMASSEFVEAVKQNQAGNKSGVAPQVNLQLSQANQASGENHFSGLMAIASLAALLLLTLFVFPNFIDSSVAKLDPEKVENVGSDTANVESPQSADVNTPITRAPRNMRMIDSGNGGVVESPLSNAAVEQVLIVKVDSSDLAGVQGVLTNNSIEVENRSDDETADSVEAIYLVSTPMQMRKVISQLASELSAQVTTFPLPASVIKAGSSTRLDPLKFSGNAEQVQEIVELDRWFGLSDETDDNKPTRFLLLVGE